MLKKLNCLFVLTLGLASSAGLAEEQTAVLNSQLQNCAQVEGALRSAYLQKKESWPCHALLPGELAALPKRQKQQESQELVALGEALFHEPRLSSDGKIACASCHQPNNYFNDSARISKGVEGREGHRTTPSLMNVALWPQLFWDSREPDLTALAVQPLTNPVEMNSSPQYATEQVAQADEYAPLFIEAFGDRAVSWQRIAEALAAFQRTIRSEPYPYEQFLVAIEAGEYQQASTFINDQQLLGLHVFRTRARCVQCHHGSMLSDFENHNMGLHYYGRKFEDLGRYALTQQADDVGKFRTPSLRHLSQTGPWMHNGLFTQLPGIINMYSHGGPRPKPRGEQVSDPLFPETSALLLPFELSDEERAALLVFLHML